MDTTELIRRLDYGCAGEGPSLGTVHRHSLMTVLTDRSVSAHEFQPWPLPEETMIKKTEEILYRSGDSDYAVPPGDTLSEYMHDCVVTTTAMAERTGLDHATINGLQVGTTHLTPEIADALELGTGIRASLWLRLEEDYRSTLARLHPDEGHDSWPKTT